MAPIWEEFAETIGTDKIVIAKMDATANDLPADAPFQIQGKIFDLLTKRVPHLETIQGKDW